MNDIFIRLQQNQKKLAELPVFKIIEILGKTGEYFKHSTIQKELLKYLPQITGFSYNMCKLGVNELINILTPHNLIQRLTGEFGNLEVLDKFYPDKTCGLLKKVQSLGVILHIAPGNVFLGIIDSIIMSFITKNASLVKLSSRDTFTPGYFAKILNKTDDTGVLSSCLDFIETAHSSNKLKELCAKADGILFWGGETALKFYKSHAGEHTRLIANGPRYSFAVIQEEILSEKDYKALSHDIIMWEQLACSSPQIIYVLGNLEKFAEKLNKALTESIAQGYAGEISFDEKVEILKERESNRIKAIEHGEQSLFTYDNPDFSLIKLYKDNIKMSPGHRTVFLKNINKPEDVVRCITEFKPYLQTAGIKVSQAKTEALIQDLSCVGVLRIMPLGQMALPVWGSPHDGEYLLTKLVNFVTYYQSDEEKLIEICDFASKHSPYYQKIIPENPDFASIPLLDRKMITQISPPISKEILTDKVNTGFYFCSGGTSGNPKYSFYTNEDFELSTDILADIYKQAGINSNDIVANLFIAGNLWTSFLVVNSALQKIGCINLPIGGNSRICDIAKYLIQFKPNTIVGLPSIIISLAQYIYEQKNNISIEKILYGGEHLSLPAQDFLKQTLKVKSIHSAGYAIVEAGPVGVQCKYLSGSLHHAILNYNHIEFIKDNKPVKDGEKGEIVVTNLKRKLMPVIRFRTGDLGRKLPEVKCTCGNSNFIFELLGRCDDMLVIGGINLQLPDIARAISRVKELLPVFQLIARTDGYKEKLIIRVETGSCKIMDSTLRHTSTNSVTECIAGLPTNEQNVKIRLLSALESEAENLYFSFSKGLINIEIELLESGKIERNVRTGKIKKVIDMRKPSELF